MERVDERQHSPTSRQSITVEVESRGIVYNMVLDLSSECVKLNPVGPGNAFYMIEAL